MLLDTFLVLRKFGLTFDYYVHVYTGFQLPNKVCRRNNDHHIFEHQLNLVQKQMLQDRVRNVHRSLHRHILAQNQFFNL